VDENACSPSVEVADEIVNRDDVGLSQEVSVAREVVVPEVDHPSLSSETTDERGVAKETSQ
jgi:hypothetical protein